MLTYQHIIIILIVIYVASIRSVTRQPSIYYQYPVIQSWICNLYDLALVIQNFRVMSYLRESKVCVASYIKKQWRYRCNILENETEETMFKVQLIIFIMLLFSCTIRSYNLKCKVSTLSKRTRRLRQLSMVASDNKQLVFLGTPEIAANVLKMLSKELLLNNWNIAAVVTQPPALNGKKKSM